MQRSFAAEFLSPFDAVDEMLSGDYSLENQQEVADHFNVSPMTIRTSLVNHKRIDREGFDFETSTS
jgi:Zn-dependent peptidase ImmA (M78 family)